MYKLLNQEEQSKVAKEYNFRLIIVGLSLASCGLLFAMLSMLPSLILTKGQEDSALLTLDNAEKFSKADSGVLKTWALALKQKLAIISPATSPDMPYEWFGKLLPLKPSGIKVVSLWYQKAGTKLTLRVNGVAKDRQTLLLFQGNLNKSGYFNKFDFPVDSLAKDTDINFDFSLTPLP